MLLKSTPQFQGRLLRWYHTHARDLPWRRTKDPYKILVSEIMLQQTQVETVIPYYERWMKQFPRLQSLAKASSLEVMKHWAGLGYYRRARMLHKTAKILCRQFAGKIPNHTETLLKLPGIGRYTSGAIASVAFGQKAPILDGNVTRILTRLTTFAGDIRIPKNTNNLWKLSNSLLPDDNPGDFNQAMMELGATVCLPDGPRCRDCPVSGFCQAYQKGRPTYFPIKSRSGRIEKRRTVALILRRDGKVFVKKQPENGRWGGLWTFPFWKDRKAMLRDIPTQAKDLKRCMTLYHRFTRYRIRLDVYECNIGMHPKLGIQISENIASNIKKPLRARWIHLQDLPKLAFPSPHQKIVKGLVEGNN